MLPAHRLKGRVLLDLFSEPDIFGILWEATSHFRGINYPPLPDLYAPTMNVSWLIPNRCCDAHCAFPKPRLDVEEQPLMTQYSLLLVPCHRPCTA